jgi:hypothetical protein
MFLAQPRTSARGASRPFVVWDESATQGLPRIMMSPMSVAQYLEPGNYRFSSIREVVPVEVSLWTTQTTLISRAAKIGSPQNSSSTVRD